MKGIAVLAALLASVAAPAQALTIKFSRIQGDSLSDTQAEAFQLAANAWSAIIKNDVTLSVQIGFASLGDRILGQTSSVYQARSADTVETALRKSATTALDKQIVLPSVTTNTISYTSAQAKALGLLSSPSTASDGSIEFSTGFAFSDRRNASGGIRGGTYDLIGIAEHEIGHLLGFVSNADWNTASETVLDLFRYDSPGHSSLQSGAAAYFSLDGGTTNIADFADGKTNQASHWIDGTRSNGVPALMDPEVGAGSVRNITALDVAALDAIGWDAALTQVSAVPLPASAPLFGAALMVLGVVGLRARERGKAA